MSSASPLQSKYASWLELFFVGAALPGPVAEKYSDAFQSNEMPPPTCVEVLQYGITHETLKGLGVDIMGHRVAIIAACGAALHSQPHHVQKENSVSFGEFVGSVSKPAQQSIEKNKPSRRGTSAAPPNATEGEHDPQQVTALGDSFVGSFSRPRFCKIYGNVQSSRNTSEEEGSDANERDNSNKGSDSSSCTAETRTSAKKKRVGNHCKRRHRQRPSLPHEAEDMSGTASFPLLCPQAVAVPLSKGSSDSNSSMDGGLTLLRDDIVQEQRFIGRNAFAPFTWVDLCGRDKMRHDYTDHLRRLAEDFNFSHSLLVDIDLTLALPQLITSPDEPHQFLVILRIAAESTGIEEDSLHYLTNRWMVAVNLNTNCVITIHRADCSMMAELRRSWKEEFAEDSIGAFLCRLFDDSLLAYVDALQDSEALLDKYEALMLKHTVGAAVSSDLRARYHNKEYSEEMTGSAKFSRQRMNQLLYHLHRRCSVYNRMLTLMQTTLEASYISLRICNDEYAEQMSRSCGELAVKAETLHDNCQNLLNLHLSLVSFQTNELMNILTTFSAVFIPITFVTGVYGMNFDNMPELHWEYGYYICLGFMGFIVGCVMCFFRLKGLI